MSSSHRSGEGLPRLAAGESRISAGAGVDVAIVSERDPYQLFRELMVVVEELCPTWPARDTFGKHRIFLL